MDARYSQPPFDAVMPLGMQSGFLVGSGLILAGFICWALIKLLRDRDSLPVLALLGGVVVCVWEPMVDVLGQCWHPISGQMTAYEALGRKIPLVLPVTNPWYFGGIAALLYYRFKRGVTAQWLYKTWGALMIAAFLLEVTPLQYGTWIYYGDQPFRVAGFPLWWSFVNIGGVIVSATLIYAVQKFISNPLLRAAGVVCAIPVADGIANAGAGWPVWYALNLPHDAPISGYAATYPAALLTAALSGMLIYFCGLLVTHQNGRPASTHGVA